MPDSNSGRHYMTQILTNTDGRTVSPTDPHGVSLTTPPSATFKQVPLPNGDGGLLYWPAQNAFLAFYPEDLREIYAIADEHTKKIEALQAANQKVTQASLDLRSAQKSGVKAEIEKKEQALKVALSEMSAASDEVKKKLEPLSKPDAKDGVKMIELVGRKTKDYDKKGVPIYVTTKALERTLKDKRIFLLNGDAKKRTKEDVIKAWKINPAEIKRRIAENVQDKAKFEKKWKLKPDDAEEFSGILTQWAKTMNGNLEQFLDRQKGELETRFQIDPNDPKRIVDLTAGAQLMRYTAGAGLAINFSPFNGDLFDSRDKNWGDRLKRGVKSGEFGIKANAAASFSLAEGKVGTDVYLPHFAGWHATVEIADQHYELGYWRFSGQLMLTGHVGASLAVETDIAISLVGGKQGVHGAPRTTDVDLVRAGANAGLNVFAGVTAGAEIKGALQWLNPEGAASKGKPVNVNAGGTVAEFKDMALISYGVAGNAGIGVKGTFKITHEKGKFAIYIKAGACLGLGGTGTLKYEADYDRIGEFFKCVAYQLKRADFHKISDLIDRNAYEAYCQIRYIIIAKGESLGKYFNKEAEEIKEEFDDIVDEIDSAISSGSKQAADFLRRIRDDLNKKTSSWFSYAPPEVVGKIMWQIHNVGSSNNQALRSEVPGIIEMALGAPQTRNQLATIAERMTPVMGDKQDASLGFAMIELALVGSNYSQGLQQTEQRLANVDVVLSAPFIWNSEPGFIVSRMAIEHPMYA
jgi:hypothetical protein